MSEIIFVLGWLWSGEKNPTEKKILKENRRACEEKLQIWQKKPNTNKIEREIYEELRFLKLEKS